MRILFVSDTYYPHINGVYYFVCRIGPLLQEKGHQVAVIAPSETTHLSHKKIDGLDVYGVPSLPVLYYPKVRFAIPVNLKSNVKKLIEQFKPDIIHIQDHFPIGKAVVEVNKKWGIPIIGTNHFMPENLTAMLRSETWKRRVTQILWSGFSKVYNHLSLVTTPTETGANLIRSRLKPEVLAISSGIDLEMFNPHGDTTEVRKKYAIPDKPILLYVGRVDPEKNLDEVLHAVALALKKIDFRFVIVGKGIKKAALEKLAIELGIADRVIFTGFVPDADLPYFYKMGRSFIIASIAELLSLATLQAMASGLPIIAVNAGALHELVRDQSNGFLFKSGDIPAIEHCICEIIERDDLFKKMSEKSLEYIVKHDIRNTLRSFEKIYQSSSTKATHKKIIRVELQNA
ncbi:MAG: glycosyltransferase [Bacteroidetes bacterium]|nr:glycosyltransferase [Bacteroidota bacterium]